MDLEKQIGDSLYHMSIGGKPELYRDDEGGFSIRQNPMPYLREPMRQAEPKDQSVTEALTEIPFAAGGMVKGAAEGIAGLGGDIEGIVRGIANVMSRGEGESVGEAFGRGFDEATLPTPEDIREKIDPVVMPLVPEDQQELVQEAADVGQMTGLPGAGLALKGGVKAAKEIPTLAEGSVDIDLLTGGLASKLSDPNNKLISQRLPTGAKATEDPIANKLVIDTQSVLQQPEKKLQTNFERMAVYPNMPEDLAQRSPEEAAQTLKDHVVDNLLFIHDMVPEGTRKRSQLWYDGANKISQDYATKYDIPLESVSGAMAALSPQKDWYQNADLGRRLMETMFEHADEAWSPSMTEKLAEKFNPENKIHKPLMDAVMGKRLSDLELPAEKAMWIRVWDEVNNPRAYPIVMPEGDFGPSVLTNAGAERKVAWGSLNEIGKAVISIESGGDLKVLSDAMGGQHKVRNFYNNIYMPMSPNGDVTIDTHAVAAGLMRPLAGDATEVHHNFGSSPDKPKRDIHWTGGMSNTSVTGTKGVYGIYADAYREAAKQRGILPRQMQSITWEAVRGMFSDTAKRDPEFVKSINSIWNNYKQGKLTLQEAQSETVKTSGYTPPTWEQ